MSFGLKKIIFHNRAPFEHIEIDFAEKGISILNAVNGGGKTTILSHIADAWHEMVRIAFLLEFEGKENKYYRISTSTFSLDNTKPSLVYMKFIFDSKDIDYLDLHEPCTKEQYDTILTMADKIPYETIRSQLEEGGNIKYLSEQSKKEIEKIFSKNVISYFPAYRHEQPGYLNDPFKIKINYALESRISGRLRNPIEVITDLPQLANWIMDMLLDGQFCTQTVIPTIKNMEVILSAAILIKSKKLISIGIGQRMAGSTRIQIGERQSDGQWTRTVYPSIFNMSSGENALVCLFGEILRQFDNIIPNRSVQTARGIVLIDEVDKHLHIRLQKEVLPKMFSLFPNIQFIISSHSPFVSMGLHECQNTSNQIKIIDLDNKGAPTDSSSTQVFREAYEAMIPENERYKDMFDKLNASMKPILYVEDEINKIYKIAWLKLKGIDFSRSEVDAKFDSKAPFIVESGCGAGRVTGLLNCNGANVFAGKKIIGLFDYDTGSSEQFHNKINNPAFLPRKENIQGSIREGFFRKRKDHECMVALLLPVPERLDRLITSNGNWECDAKYANYVEIETLLPESFLKGNPNYEIQKEPSSHYKAKDSHKQNLWKELVTAEKNVFNDFIPLFKRVYEFFDLHFDLQQQIVDEIDLKGSTGTTDDTKTPL